MIQVIHNHRQKRFNLECALLVAISLAILAAACYFFLRCIPDPECMQYVSEWMA